MNRVILSGVVAGRDALRWTPAGLPALNLSLLHEGTVSEDGHPRKVSIEMRAVGIGAITQALTALPLGGAATFGGFLAGGRNGRGVVLHVTEVEPAPATASSAPAP